MKKKIFFAMFLLLLLLISAYADSSDKKVILFINGQDADTKPEAVEVHGPGTFTLTGKIRNNLTKVEEKKNLDLVFILDASGSMQSEINAVKNSIRNIIDEINNKCPNCMMVGIYVFEGVGSDKTGFIKKPSYCHGSNDVGAIHLTSDGGLLKNRLGQVRASSSIEPWAHLTKQVLEDSSFGWRADAVRMIIAISDEPNDYCNSESDAKGGLGDTAGLDNAVNTLKANDAYFFGIYSEDAEQGMKYIKNQGVKGDIYYYSNPNDIPNKVVQAIHYVLGNDSFLVTREEGPAGWDDLAANFVVENVARDGGEKTFSITLKTPNTYDQPEVYFRYRIQVKGDPALYDDAWLKVLMNRPPVAAINALTPLQGDVNLDVTMNAVGTTDPDGEADLKRFEWNCGNGQTFTTTKINENVTCTYREKNKSYTVRMTAYDSVNHSSWAEITVKTNPNKPPTIGPIIAKPGDPHIGEETTFTVNASDPDGTIVRYEWDFGDGEKITCSTDSGQCDSVKHVYSSKQTFHVTVLVTDNDGDTALASTDIKIANRYPNKPVINATPRTGLAPLSVLFTISNFESLDPDGDPIVLYEWDFGDGQSESRTEPQITHTYLDSNGMFSAKCRARDAGVDGGWSEWSDPIQISTLQLNAMYDFDAKDVNLYSKTEVMAVCTGSINSMDVNIINDESGLSVYTASAVPCDAAYHQIDYNFTRPGRYIIMAKVHNMPAQCLNCEAIDVIFIKKPFPKIYTPELHLLSVLIIAALTLLIAKSNGIRKN